MSAEIIARLDRIIELLADGPAASVSEIVRNTHPIPALHDLGENFDTSPERVELGTDVESDSRILAVAVPDDRLLSSEPGLYLGDGCRSCSLDSSASAGGSSADVVESRIERGNRVDDRSQAGVQLMELSPERVVLSLKDVVRSVDRGGRVRRGIFPHSRAGRTFWRCVVTEKYVATSGAGEKVVRTNSLSEARQYASNLGGEVLERDAGEQGGRSQW